MSRYKLKKWYPSLPKNWEVGCTITKAYNHYIHDKIGVSSKIIHATEVENSPEFWEKVVKKDYEILTFKTTGKHFGFKDVLSVLKSDNTYNFKDGYNDRSCTLDEMLISVNKGYNIIYSVKRLSDGEIFTIGNKITGKSDYNCTINSIDLNPSYPQIMFNKLDEGIDLMDAKHIKQPLFTTEDGVDIYEGDTVWYVEHCNKVYHEITNISNNYAYNTWYKTFSTQKAVEEYVIINAPCLSIKDVNIAIGEQLVSNILEKIVKSKLKIDDNRS